MSIEGNLANGYRLTGEHASLLGNAIDVGFDEAMKTAELLLNLPEGIHVGEIVLLPDRSIQLVTTDHLLGAVLNR